MFSFFLPPMGIFWRERRRASGDAIRSFFRRVCFGGNDVDVDVRRSRSNEGLFEDGEDGGSGIGREEKSPRRQRERERETGTERVTRLESDSVDIRQPSGIRVPMVRSPSLLKTIGVEAFCHHCMLQKMDDSVMKIKAWPCRSEGKIGNRTTRRRRP